MADQEKEPKLWYVVNTYAGHENRVKENLERRIKTMGMEDNLFRIVVAEEEEIDFKNGKQQLRRWVREEVRFPVEATLHDGSVCHGVLYDLSAGGILLGIPHEIPNGEHIRIRFELPSFGVEDVEIEILRNLGQKNPEYPDYYSLTASFAGAFGWTQERVLQYIFEVHKERKASEMARENA